MVIVDTKNIVDHTQALLERAQSSFQRQCIVFAGNENWCESTVELLNQALDLSHSLVISSNSLSVSLSTFAPMDKALHYLGHEFSHAIINCHEGIDPNVLGAVSGTVRGGGHLLCPGR